MIEVEGRPAVERVECVCGATEEDLSEPQEWVQCANCLAWQHCDCVNFNPDQQGAINASLKDWSIRITRIKCCPVVWALLTSLYIEFLKVILQSWLPEGGTWMGISMKWEVSRHAMQGYVCKPWEIFHADSFECMVCQKAKSLTALNQQSGATLIVCPTPILEQWLTEIKKHIKPGMSSLWQRLQNQETLETRNESRRCVAWAQCLAIAREVDY